MGFAALGLSLQEAGPPAERGGTATCQGTKINLPPMPLEAPWTFSPMAHRVAQAWFETSLTVGLPEHPKPQNEERAPQGPFP